MMKNASVLQFSAFKLTPRWGPVFDIFQVKIWVFQKESLGIFKNY
jgi:hypothetical protein